MTGAFHRISWTVHLYFMELPASACVQAAHTPPSRLVIQPPESEQSHDLDPPISSSSGLAYKRPLDRPVLDWKEFRLGDDIVVVHRRGILTPVSVDTLTDEGSMVWLKPLGLGTQNSVPQNRSNRDSSNALDRGVRYLCTTTASLGQKTGCRVGTEGAIRSMDALAGSCPMLF